MPVPIYQHIAQSIGESLKEWPTITFPVPEEVNNVNIDLDDLKTILMQSMQDRQMSFNLTS